jgi:hypothetical protein
MSDVVLLVVVCLILYNLIESPTGYNFPEKEGCNAPPSVNLSAVEVCSLPLVLPALHQASLLPSYLRAEGAAARQDLGSLLPSLHPSRLSMEFKAAPALCLADLGTGVEQEEEQLENQEISTKREQNLMKA